MKNLIVYYSWTGNTEIAAKELHRLIGGDLDKIEEVKPRSSKYGFMSGAFGALFGLKSKIKHANFPLNNYDNIYIGAQVWALNSAPAINSYISEADLKDKNVYLFLTLADDKFPQSTINKIAKKIDKRGGKLVDSISIKTVMNSVITADDCSHLLKNWVDKHSK